MNKSHVRTIYLAIVLSLFLILIPSVTAKKPLRCDMEMTFYWGPFQWIGTVSGDLDGDITITPSSASFPGSTEHFLETFEIVTDDGVIISGYDEGVWNLKTGRFRTNGRITRVIDDSGEMSYLVRYRVHFSGVTGALLDGETPIEGSGSVRIY